VKNLYPEAWADAALEVISEAGLESLNVESLARRLGVTKGSFYWHFSSRSSLLSVSLARWERRESELLRVELEVIPEPRARLRRLLWRGADRILERLAPSADPAVVATLGRLRERRVAQLAAVYSELGLAEQPARRRAVLAYAAYAGLKHLAPEDAERAVQLLVPGP
jgi:AcrR family transcriptional regulator